MADVTQEGREIAAHARYEQAVQNSKDAALAAAQAKAAWYQAKAAAVLAEAAVTSAYDEWQQVCADSPYR